MDDKELLQILVQMGEDRDLTNPVRDALVRRVVDRLNTGDVLFSEAQVYQVMVEDYQTLYKKTPSQARQGHFRHLIQTLNRDFPQLFVIPSIENWIVKSVKKQAEQQRWNSRRHTIEGKKAIRALMQLDKTRQLLKKLKINPLHIDVRRCVENLSNQLKNKESSQATRSAVRLAHSVKENTESAQLGERLYQDLDEVVSLSEQQIEQRKQQQKDLRKAIAKEEFGQIQTRIKSYLTEGKLTADQAKQIKLLDKVKEQQRAKKISSAQADDMRKKLLGGEQLSQRIRSAVDFAVLHLHLFEGLRLIDPQFDPALRFLIHYKTVVAADRFQPADAKAALAALRDDFRTFQLLVGLVEGKDLEVRMIAANLMPYCLVLRKDVMSMKAMDLEESFVDELRHLSRQEMSDRLNAADEGVRTRAGTDITSLLYLIHCLIRPTIFRKKLLELKDVLKNLWKM